MAYKKGKKSHAAVWGTPVFLVNEHRGGYRHHLECLEEAGFPAPICLDSLDELTAELFHRQATLDARPALAVVAVDALDTRLVERIRALRRLTAMGWLGVVTLVVGEDAAAGMEQAVLEAVLEAGCLDILRLPGQGGTDTAARLRLAMHLLHERHRRIARERRLKTQLAEQRVMEARLNYLVTHDPLTDLINRQSMEEALEAAINTARERAVTHALLYLDLDRFKLHNDAAGHGTGDRLLQRIANLLRSALPMEYPVARLGSDEFAVLLPNAGEAEAITTAERLRSTIEAIEPDEELAVYHVSASIGLVLLEPGAVSGATQVLAQAEQACYFAKARGGNAVHRFSCCDEALQHLHEDMFWAGPLRRALAEDQFFLVFQPVLSIAENRIAHYEALIRLPANVGKGEGTAAFIPAAERLGLARQIDLWTVNRAVDFLADNAALSLGVNLSSHAFQEQGLLPLLRDKLDATAIAPSRLIFEITETAAVLNFTETRRMIGELRSLGCRFALDDFGSGFSSYSYIKQFPVDMVKIDGSFIVDIHNDHRDEAIVQSMIDIAHTLDKEVVAEFIEDAQTLELLAKMGADYAQGYHIGRPVRNPVAPEKEWKP